MSFARGTAVKFGGGGGGGGGKLRLLKYWLYYRKSGDANLALWGALQRLAPIARLGSSSPRSESLRVPYNC